MRINKLKADVELLLGKVIAFGSDHHSILNDSTGNFQKKVNEIFTSCNNNRTACNMTMLKIWDKKKLGKPNS